MKQDCEKMRIGRPYVFCALRHNEGADEVLSHILEIGGLSKVR
jgi:urease accessory protein